MSGSSCGATRIIDPHTQKEMGRGYRSAQSIMDAVKDAKKSLQKEHGKGVSRKALVKVDEGISKAAELRGAIQDCAEDRWQCL